MHIPTEQPAGAGLRGYQARIAAAGFIGMIVSVSPILFSSFPVLLQPVSAEFGWGRGEMSFALMSAMFTATILYPLVGRLLDRYGSRAILLPGFGSVRPLDDGSVADERLSASDAWALRAGRRYQHDGKRRCGCASALSRVLRQPRDDAEYLPWVGWGHRRRGNAARYALPGGLVRLAGRLYRAGHVTAGVRHGSRILSAARTSS